MSDSGAYAFTWQSDPQRFKAPRAPHPGVDHWCGREAGHDGDHLCSILVWDSRINFLDIYHCEATSE